MVNFGKMATAHSCDGVRDKCRRWTLMQGEEGKAGLPKIQNDLIFQKLEHTRNIHLFNKKELIKIGHEWSHQYTGPN